MTVKRGLLLLCIILTASSALSARPVRKPAPPSMTSAGIQVPPIVNPNGIAFTPSVDEAVVENGVTLVSKYTMELFKTTAPTVVVKAVDLGMPALVSGERQWMSMAPVRVTLAAGSYTASVYAEGPGGRSAAAVSDPFSVAPRAAAATGKPRWIQ